MRRVIISGGGTGGHIYPAITIARSIADIEPTEFYMWVLKLAWKIR